MIPLTDQPMLARVGNELFTAESAAHAGVGGPGSLGCSGDVLLAALAACQEITLKLVATAMGIELESVQVTTRGDLDLRGPERRAGAALLREGRAVLRGAQHPAPGERRPEPVPAGVGARN